MEKSEGQDSEGDEKGAFTFQSIEHAHRATGGGRVSGNLNLVGRGDRGCGLFSVRLSRRLVSIIVPNVLTTVPGSRAIKLPNVCARDLRNPP